MNRLAELYRPSLALWTDLGQLTMAFGYFKTGVAGRDASFSLFFRQHPFGGGFTVACGLAVFIDYLEQFRFELEDLDYLSTLRGNDAQPLFDDHFLDYLRQLRLECEVHAAAEGTVVFPHEPLVRVSGPLLQAQLLGAALHCIIDHPSRVATKAARICQAARGGTVLDLGLGRTSGIDGGLAASRAAYVGGVDATSNVLAGRLHGIPVQGTPAHSWIMAFDDEEEAFVAYASALPGNCVFLVEPCDTLEGVRRATRVGQQLHRRGYERIGVLLDSSDLGPLSAEARRILDAAGLDQASIVATGDLDEWSIENLRQQGARVDVWGVGSELAAAHDEPAVGGVYELSAIREPGGSWQPRVTRSQQAATVVHPGVHQVRRYRGRDGFVADAIYDAVAPLGRGCTIVDPLDATRRWDLSDELSFEDLLVPVFSQGRRVYDVPTLADARKRLKDQLAGFGEQITRLHDPQHYRVGVERSLHEIEMHLLEASS